MTASPELGHTRTASPDLLRSVFRQHAAGVAVITAAGDRPVGFTATSLNSVAAEPPLISFGVGTSSSSWPVIAEAEHVGVHILGEHQQELAATFAQRRRPVRSVHLLAQWAGRCSGAGRRAGMAGLPGRGADSGGGPPDRDRPGGGRGSGRIRAAACLSPGTVHGSARLRTPWWHMGAGRWADHSAKRLLIGHALGVLASNITVGAPAAPTGNRPIRRLCCVQQGSPEMTMQ